MGDPLAQARKATDTNPTPAQIEAGNYAKGELRLHGLRIKLENPRGSIRRSKPGTTPAWERRMAHDYGYVCGYEGADGDEVDVFIGPHPESELVVIVDQTHADGSFDESKVMLGFRSVAEATAGYLAHYPKGWKLGPTTALTIEQFKAWLASGKTKRAVNGRVVMLVKAERFVKQPGVHGGIFYFNEHGKLVYGVPAPGSSPRAGIVSRQVVPTKMGRRSGMLAGERINGPADTAAIFRDATDETMERLWAVHMDKDARPTAVELLYRGEAGRVAATPSGIFKNAEALGTAALALVHNHPFDDATPSPGDYQATTRIIAVGDAVGIPIRHHITVSGDGFADITGSGQVRPWSDASPRGPKRTALIDGGKFARNPIPASLDQVLERKLHGIADIAQIGRLLLDPADQTAIALMLTNDAKVIGVYPIAMGTFSPPDLDRLTKLSIASGASMVTVVCGKDGPAWQNAAKVFHHNADYWFSENQSKPLEDRGPGGITYVDTVSVGESGFRTMNHHNLDWGNP